MKHLHSLRLTILLATALTGCGSGSDSATGTGPTTPPSGAWLTLSPARLTATAHPDESIYVQLQAEVGEFPDVDADSDTPEVRVGIFDATGTFQERVSTLSVNPDEEHPRYTVTMTTTPQAETGVRTGTLEIRVCQDDPMVCSKPYPGSPWHLPFQILIERGNLSGLTTVPGLGPWVTFQGNAAHTGHAPASFSASRFNHRWARFGHYGSADISPSIAVSDGMLIVTQGNRVRALDADTGETLWQTSLPVPARSFPAQTNPPAITNGKVYVTTTGYEENSFMWVLDQKTGAVLKQSAMSSQWGRYLAPTPYGRGIYTESGYYGGMTKFDVVSDEQRWEVGRAQTDQWTPAVDDNHVYTHIGSWLIAANPEDGETAFSIADPATPFADFSTPGAPVIVSDSQVCYQKGLITPRLICMDTAGRKVAWFIANDSMVPPAAANGALYTRTRTGLDARRASDGALLWSYPIDKSQYHVLNSDPAVVTDNLVIFSTASQVQAIDLNTREAVWTYPQSGSLTISEQGVLYILSRTGTLVAINLQ